MTQLQILHYSPDFRLLRVEKLVEINEKIVVAFFKILIIIILKLLMMLEKPVIKINIFQNFQLKY